MPSVKLSENFVKEARSAASVFNRTLTGQIEYWSRIGRIAINNPALSYQLIQNILIAQQDLADGNIEEPKCSNVSEQIKFQHTAHFKSQLSELSHTQQQEIIMAAEKIADSPTLGKMLKKEFENVRIYEFFVEKNKIVLIYNYLEAQQNYILMSLGL